MKKGDVIRLGPWYGAIAEILTNEDGDIFARVKLVKHRPGITEVHPLSALTPATFECIAHEVKIQLRLIRENLEEIHDLIG